MTGAGTPAPVLCQFTRTDRERESEPECRPPHTREQAPDVRSRCATNLPPSTAGFPTRRCLRKYDGPPGVRGNTPELGVNCWVSGPDRCTCGALSLRRLISPAAGLVICGRRRLREKIPPPTHSSLVPHDEPPDPPRRRDLLAPPLPIRSPEGRGQNLTRAGQPRDPIHPRAATCGRGSGQALRRLKRRRPECATTHGQRPQEAPPRPVLRRDWTGAPANGSRPKARRRRNARRRARREARRRRNPQAP